MVFCFSRPISSARRTRKGCQCGPGVFVSYDCILSAIHHPPIRLLLSSMRCLRISS
jgi:hypothetical protein